jgi:hypothetical protein
MAMQGVVGDSQESVSGNDFRVIINAIINNLIIRRNVNSQYHGRSQSNRPISPSPAGAALSRRKRGFDSLRGRQVNQ